MNITIYTDGAARGNPGHAGAGIVIYNDKGEIIEQHCKYLGIATNNEAEYNALKEGLTIARKYIPCEVSVCMDSELIVRQMLGKYRVKNERLFEYFTEIKSILPTFKKISFTHIPREKNKLADALANKALDERI